MKNQVLHLPERLYFVSGIDTNVGKTFATGYLARELAAQGKKVITQKFIQTGCKDISEDILMHRTIQGIPLTEEDKQGITCPYVLSYPCSPHMASQMDGISYDTEKIRKASETLCSIYDLVLLEGAGGLMVPLCEDYLTIDYVAEQQPPLLLVSSGKLGSINHTLLSLEACARRGIKVTGLVYNRYPVIDPLIEENTKQFLINFLRTKYPTTQWIEIPEIA